MRTRVGREKCTTRSGNLGDYLWGRYHELTWRHCNAHQNNRIHDELKPTGDFRLLQERRLLRCLLNNGTAAGPGLEVRTCPRSSSAELIPAATVLFEDN